MSAEAKVYLFHYANEGKALVNVSLANAEDARAHLAAAGFAALPEASSAPAPFLVPLLRRLLGGQRTPIATACAS